MEYTKKCGELVKELIDKEIKRLKEMIGRKPTDFIEPYWKEVENDLWELENAGK